MELFGRQLRRTAWLLMLAGFSVGCASNQPDFDPFQVDTLIGKSAFQRCIECDPTSCKGQPASKGAVAPFWCPLPVCLTNASNNKHPICCRDC